MDRERALGCGSAVEVVQTVATRLGIGLASIVNVFDPRMIVVGGVLEHVLELGEQEVHEAMARQLDGAARVEVRVCKPHLGQDSSLIGAAELAFDELLDTALAPRWLGSSATRRRTRWIRGGWVAHPATRAPQTAATGRSINAPAAPAGCRAHGGDGR